MHWEDLQVMPALIPIRENKKQTKVYRGMEDQFLNKDFKERKIQFKQEKKNVEKTIKPLIDSEIIDQISNKFKRVHDRGIKQQNTQKDKNNEKIEQNFNSKLLITDMMHKIKAKNISEELNPITAQKIKHLIIKTNDNLVLLQAEAERKGAMLIINSNNQHLKKEIQDIKASIDRCITIKELYHEKINFRNKISVLQANIIDLKDQNRNLQIKISKGISDAENHKYHLPCERQKILSEQLKSCEAQLIKQKNIGEKLSKNISEIMKNFNRLYQEAETARLIVAQKLRQLQTKEKDLVDAYSNNQKSVSLEKKSLQQQALIERNLKGSSNKKNSNALNSQMYQTQKRTNQAYNYIQPTKQTTQQNVKTKGKSYSLEEQMRNMLSNQSNASRFIKY